MKKGKCLLCGNEGDLLNRSHIIPDFMYEPAYDDKHRLLLFAPAQAAQGGGVVRKPPTAPYDSAILCPDCDNRKLNAYEDYAAKFLFGKNLPGTIAPSVQNFKDPSTGFGETVVGGINYSLLKLFILSLLWRSHISQHTFFTEVRLGPYAEVLRKALLSGAAPSENEFPVFFMGWVTTTSISQDMVSQPVHFKWQQKDHAYLFMFRGLIVWVFMSKDADTSAIDRHKLKEEGTLCVLNLPESAMRDFFAKVFKIKAP